MKPATDRERLLAELLADAEPSGFREALLHETLHLAGRRRRLRTVRQSTGAVAAVALGAVLAWRLGSPVKEIAAHRAPAYATVQTESLPARAIVHTQRFEPGYIVASTASVDVIHTTAASGRFQTIGDDELLALANPRPAALVRRGPHSAELIFTDADDQEDFPLN